MKNTKRILAAAGIILLVGMYAATIVFACIDSPHTYNSLKISIGLTILIPVLLWIYTAMYHYIKQRRDANQNVSNGKNE
ncbi:MAG: hypothetical protein HFJ04_10110 [Lachnospiraceae bacterium]|nr:hypothetical protein [Lachnospiraceae bacterium]